MDIVGKEEPSHKVIKKQSIGEVKPIEQDDDDDAQVQVHHDPPMNHGSTNAHGDASKTKSGHDSREQVNQGQTQVNESNQEVDQGGALDGFSPNDIEYDDDEDDGPIQRRSA